MRIKASREFKFRVVSSITGNQSATRASLIRGSIFLALILMTAPLGVAKEIAYGTPTKKRDLKSSLRSMLWVWNRSWFPVKPRIGTYHDIGWYLSSESCLALRQKGFLSKDPLKRKCDIAQLSLSIIRDCVQTDDGLTLARVDQEILSLVNSVLNEANQWAASVDGNKPGVAQASSASNVKANSTAKDFNNETTSLALLHLDDLCSAIGQEYFLVSGTFLGVVRDGGFIGHDSDIDVGVFENKLLEKFLPTLIESKEFSVVRIDHPCVRKVDGEGVQYHFMEKPAVIKLVHKTGIAIDIFVHFYDGNLVWHGSSIHRWDNKRFDLIDYEFLGRVFKGAGNYDLYLRENYGEDWREPKPDFDSSIDTPNLTFVGTLNALVHFSWGIANAVADNKPARVRKYIEMLSSIGALELKGDILQVT